MNELGFSLAIQALAFGTFAWEASGEGYLQAPLHKTLLDANHGTATDGERLGNLPIGVTGFTLALIAHQQHTRH
ncbi:MAG: hypothetical protein J2P37_17285 [Ktedonobacteraceae bacterium]|nr:hypothetical protein [Ktedonobacteraceae bacterium]MBO0792418.1 hypothetical protein [Ktedonobacteraceae bacterium]